MRIRLIHTLMIGVLLASGGARCFADIPVSVQIDQARPGERLSLDVTLVENGAVRRLWTIQIGGNNSAPPPPVPGPVPPIPVPVPPPGPTPPAPTPPVSPFAGLSAEVRARAAQVNRPADAAGIARACETTIAALRAAPLASATGQALPDAIIGNQANPGVLLTAVKAELGTINAYFWLDWAKWMLTEKTQMYFLAGRLNTAPDWIAYLTEIAAGLR